MRIAVIIVLILLLPLPVRSTTHESSGRHGKDQAINKRVLEKINEARINGRKCGNKYYKAVRPLVWNEILGRAALNHSLDMAKKAFLSHTGSDGSNPGQRLSRAGYRWIAYGECVAEGYQTPEESVSSWLKSDMHCKNIMNPEFKEAGSAYVRSGSLRTYWTLVLGASRR